MKVYYLTIQNQLKRREISTKQNEDWTLSTLLF